MRRRKFIALLGSAAAMWPLASRAQQAAKPLIGFLHSGSPDRFAHLVAALRQGLSQSGFTEGQNLTIEYRWAENKYDRLPALAADLVRHKVQVIAASGGVVGVLAAKRATTSIPIVFTASDPLRFGIVKSLSRPEGNLTGVGLFTASMGAKRLQLLRELAPSANLIGFLANPAYPTTEAEVKDMQEAVRASGKQFSFVTTRSESDINAAFVTFARQKAGALVIAADPFFTNWRDRIVALAEIHAILAMYFQREFVTAGGLISYGTSLTDAYRQIGVYTARILKGAKPADLPVVQPTKFELVINLKTAKALGLTVPPGLLVAADEVIE